MDDDTPRHPRITGFTLRLREPLTEAQTRDVLALDYEAVFAWNGYVTFVSYTSKHPPIGPIQVDAIEIVSD